MSNSTIYENNGAFIETDATITYDGRSYSSGSAFLAKRVDTGKYVGILYAFKNANTQVEKHTYAYCAGSTFYSNGYVGAWDGSIKIPARFSNVWQSNMGDFRQSVYFTHGIDGVTRYFHGVFYCSGSDIVRVTEVKPW